MFGKPKKNVHSTLPDVTIATIPAEFYGGQNPSIQFKNTTKATPAAPSPVKPLLSKADKKALDSATASGSGHPFHPATLFTDRRFLIITGSCLFVLFIIGAGWFYWHQATSASIVKAPPTAPVAVIPTPTPTPVVVPTDTANSVVTIPPSTTPTVPTPTLPALAGGSLDFPSGLLGNSIDSDNDGLSDAEEQLFGTDPGNPNTANNGFSDSSNVFWLYDPTSKNPSARLIDSGLVKEYINPVFNYKIYYPSSWAVGSVDTNDRDILFSTITGENIEMRVFDLDPNQTFADWFAIWAPDQKMSELTSFSTVFQFPGMRRQDYLVYYFQDQKYRYVLLYHPADPSAATINYREVIKMMAHSFQPFGAASSSPAFDGGVTSTLESSTSSSLDIASSSTSATATSSLSATTSTTTTVGPLAPSAKPTTPATTTTSSPAARSSTSTASTTL